MAHHNMTTASKSLCCHDVICTFSGSLNGRAAAIALCRRDAVCTLSQLPIGGGRGAAVGLAAEEALIEEVDVLCLHKATLYAHKKFS